MLASRPGYLFLLCYKEKSVMLMADPNILSNFYYRPGGYYVTSKGFASALKKAGYVYPLPEIEAWLKRQAVWQMHRPPPRYVARPTNQVTIPNQAHEADVLYLQYD